MKSQFGTISFIIIDTVTLIIILSGTLPEHFDILRWVITNTVTKLIGLVMILLLYEQSKKRNQASYKYFTVPTVGDSGTERRSPDISRRVLRMTSGALFIVPLIINIFNILYNITLINCSNSLISYILVMSLPLELFLAQFFVSKTPMFQIINKNDYTYSR